MATIKLDQIKKSFGKVDVIKGVDLDIKNKEFVVFVGPSGCGKSTLLRMIAGLEDITSGTIVIDGQVVNDAAALGPRHRHGLPVLRALPAHDGLRQHGVRAEARAGAASARSTERVRTRRACCRLERASRAASPSSSPAASASASPSAGPSSASPRSSSSTSRCPTSMPALRVQMRIEISKLHQRLSATMIYVTHDQVEAMTLGRSHRRARTTGDVEQVGTPIDLYDQPGQPVRRRLHRLAADELPAV